MDTFKIVVFIYIMKNDNYYFRYVCYNTFLRQNKQI